MRRAMITAGFSTLLLILAAAPAFAAFGALAYDEAAGKHGFSWNEENQGKADDVAMKICGSDKCKIIFRTAARECGALAQAETGNGWGGAKRPQRAAAELAAKTDCEKHTKGQCKIKEAACNR